MADYLVSWEIDIEGAVDREDAAEKARAHFERSGSIAHVFEVTDKLTGVTSQVDLDYGTVSESVTPKVMRVPQPCPCRSGYANNPMIHNNQVRTLGFCSCQCHL